MTIFDLFIIVLTSTLTYFTTIYIPQIKVVYRRYMTRKNAKLTALIRAEVSKQLKDIIND